MDFDASSKAWMENKIKISDGNIVYKCKICNRQRMFYSKNNKKKLDILSIFCKKHQYLLT